MPKYKKGSHWNNISLRQLAGAACYVETAIKARVWDWDRLELMIDQRDYGERTGKYRKWVEGTLPRISSCRKVQNVLKCRYVERWRNQPYWRLFCSDQCRPENIDLALQSIQGDMQRYIWSIWPEKGETFRSVRSVTGLENIKAVAEYNNFNALVALTAWAREAHDLNILKSAYQASFYSRNIFARAVCNSPHLFIRWPLLAEMYKNLIWSPLIDGVSIPWMHDKWDELQEEMATEERKARQRGVKLPPKRIFEQINYIDLATLL